MRTIFPSLPTITMASGAASRMPRKPVTCPSSPRRLGPPVVLALRTGFFFTFPDFFFGAKAFSPYRTAEGQDIALRLSDGPIMARREGFANKVRGKIKLN